MYSKLHQRQFVNMAIELLSLEYNKNREILHKIMQFQNMAFRHYLHKESNDFDVKHLIKEQIKINQLIIIGKSMINKQ